MNDKYNSSRTKSMVPASNAVAPLELQPSKRVLHNILSYARCVQHIQVKDMDIKINLN
jgi:hypothetical protein